MAQGTSILAEMREQVCGCAYVCMYDVSCIQERGNGTGD